MKKTPMHFSTQLIHGGESPLIERAVIQPIFQSSTFETIPVADYKDNRYLRLNNTPNHISLGKKLAAIEGAESGLVTGSGMAAITTALLSLVKPGGHVLAQDQLYGGTHGFFVGSFEGLGRQVSFFRADEVGSLEKHLRPNTQVVYTEAVSNPLLRILDHGAVTQFAKKHKLISLIDNTFPSPYNFNPISVGYDVVLHSATKYLNGHTDIVAGAVMGKEAHIDAVLRLLNYLGGCLDTHPCFLLDRGMKTLAVRMRYQNESALALARALEKHPKCAKVIYPGLPSHPDHAKAKEYFKGFGGMLSFEYQGTAEQTDAALARLKLCISAPSLGGVESLVTRPVNTSHSAVSKQELEKLGIRETLVRVSVGLEDTEDLIADFNQALNGG